MALVSGVTDCRGIYFQGLFIYCGLNVNWFSSGRQHIYLWTDYVIMGPWAQTCRMLPAHTAGARSTDRKRHRAAIAMMLFVVVFLSLSATFCRWSRVLRCCCWFSNCIWTSIFKDSLTCAKPPATADPQWLTSTHILWLIPQQTEHNIVKKTSKKAWDAGSVFLKQNYSPDLNSFTIVAVFFWNVPVVAVWQ